MQYPANNLSGLESIMIPAPILFFLALVSRFVLLYNFRLDTTTGIYWYAVLSRPQPYRFRVRATVRGGLGASCRTATSASYFAASVGEACQCFTQFISVSLIEVNFVVTAVKGERYCFTSFRAVNIIFQKHYCLFCHELRLSVC